ncbi:lutropin-choriogonadotropic hormone receptor-like isoform X1 [Rhopalosiphum maidis]|uniref:lutropin-choriogonadotropic hormone receptor-like isoform X1 n=1 Tax=Rhopalosiphum maidis TaxID=43146 RepID=UPI000EFF33C3|nr:lutropin-choriogonadotropic hormone receptor-like isoform X1 [Rhopalosiphum maidis]
MSRTVSRDSSRTDDVNVTTVLLVASNDRRKSVVVNMRRHRFSSNSWISMWSIFDFLMVLCIFIVQLSAKGTVMNTPCTIIDNCCVRNMTNFWKHKTELHCSGIQQIPVVNEIIHVLTIDDSDDIKELSAKSISPYSNLTDIILNNMKNLEYLDSSTFKNLNKLQSLYILRASVLKELSSDIFHGLSKTFLVLRISKANLRVIPDLSDLGTPTAMHIIEFEGNQLDTLQTNGIKTRAEQLLLEYNKISVIENWAFNGSEIAKLSLRGNYLDFLSEHSFDGILNLRTLDLSHSSMKVLPTSGLKSLEVLRVENAPSMTVIPSVYLFGNLKEAYLTYSFHCCSFQFPAKHDYSSYEFHKEGSQTPSECVQMKKNYNFHVVSNDFIENGYIDYANDSEEQFFNEPAITNSTQDIICGNITPPTTRSDVKCWPQPNALNPCEDIMGFYWLRVCVWLVGIAALLANVVVMLVVFRKKFNYSVPRFLMSNLAFADFCTAIYLLLLAYEDLVSSEKYFNYAYTWQNGVGCKIGGFLTVFSSQLSVFALCLLTIERWYSIRRALYTNKMTFASTVRIMAFGWVYSIVMATMPLLGISSYSTTSICLPMDTARASGMCYVFTLLTFAAAAFLLMLFCYVQIYTSLSYETRHAAKGEASVARKISVLIGTNFACTAPVIFFGFTALLGYPLIDVTKSKILLVFFYPINSCANPFLYTILTASFRREAFSTVTKFGLCLENEKEYKVIYSTQTNNTQRLTPVHRQTLSLTLPQP